MPSLIQPVSITCPVAVIGAKSYNICLPGGACISGQVPDLFASPDELCRALLGQLQVAIAPLKPAFDIIGTILCIKDTLEAAPKIVTQPQEFVEVLNSCIIKIEDLAQLIPQLSAPIFIAQALDLMICILEGFVTELQGILNKAQQIDSLLAMSRGDNDPILQIVECANRLNQNRLCAINESMGPLNAILELLNIFLKMIGMDPLPSMSDLDPGASKAITQFRDFIRILKQVRTALGIPVTPVVPRC